MIDFKKLLKENPRFSEKRKVAKLIDDMEQRLLKKIEAFPNHNQWFETFHNNNSSTEYLKEMHSYIQKEYVSKKLTQMTVVFSEEMDHPTNYSPAQIVFSIKRSDAT